ncbi:hypothetical protein ACHAXR_001036, partial [Thalassiosira sp. AJA248-18]
MLSGIKTGKRKRPATRAPSSSTAGIGHANIQNTDGAVVGEAVGTNSGSSGGGSGNNRSAAEALRLSLLGGGDGNKSDSNIGSTIKIDKSDIQSKLEARMSSYKQNESAIHSLQSRGRISNESISASKGDNNDTIVINSGAAAAAAGGSQQSSTTIQYENEHKIRYNSRGKLSRHAHAQLRQKTEQEMTIEEMATQERSGTANDMDEIYARNMLKMGKGFKKLEKAMGTNSRSGADEEDYLQETADLSNLYRSNDDKLSPAELAARSTSRQIAQHDVMAKWTSKSWWWMESPKFEKRYLIALGEKVSLVMTPTHKRLQQPQQEVKKKGSSAWDGGQCYIVPLPYSESFVGLDEEVWYEVQRFQSSLRQMFHKLGRGV